MFFIGAARAGTLPAMRKAARRVPAATRARMVSHTLSFSLSSMQDLVVVNRLVKRYGPRFAVPDVSFAVDGRARPD